MKLEPDLIKKILQWCEDTLPDSKRSWSDEDIRIKGFTNEQVNYHLKLLCENGYLDYIDASTLSGFGCIVNHLSWDGNQYLKLLNSKAMNIAKSIFHETGVIFAEGAIKAIIDKYGSQLLT